MAGILLGLSVIDMINTFRIVLNFLVGRYDKTLFHYTHTYMGEILMAIGVISCVCVWIMYIQSNRGLDAPQWFLLRVTGLSGLLFFPWLWVNKAYMMGIDAILNGLFSAFGNPLTFTYQHNLYGQTFSWVTLTALILATRHIPSRRKMAFLFFGWGILFFLHLLSRFGNVMVTAYGVNWMVRTGEAVHAAGRFLLPILIWFRMTRPAKHGQK